MGHMRMHLGHHFCVQTSLPLIGLHLVQGIKEKGVIQVLLGEY